MKQSSNSFTGGLVLDMHPLTTLNTLLTDALNATLITYNGNEMMLQNDMGNTLIQDSATGNIMGLSPGFIPIGMKEHGGIMYIASVDKEGNGEIGTIPSPIIRDFYKDRVIFEVNQSIPINVGDAIKISNKLYPADKFITNLQMYIDESNLIGQTFKKNSGLSQSPESDPSDIILGRDVIRYTAGLANKQTLYTPVLSYNSNISEIQLQTWGKKPLFSSKGVYSLELYSRHDNSSDIPANSLSSPLIYQYDGEFKESNYWYLHTESPTDVFPKDLLTATLNQDLKQFPSNNKPGYLAVKLLTEGINKFDILPRAKDPFYTPITYKTFQSGESQYYTYFPGFYYSTDSGIYIDRIEARVIDESTAKEMELAYPYLTTIPQFTVNNLEDNSRFNSFFDNPIELKDLFKNNDETDHMYNAYSNTLPQVQSVSDDKSFILTTLKQIEDHNQTDMESSTGGENKTYGGVFCVPLGNKYNNWYRAEIDYYDLYDNKQGTFTKRFNPYLNDVFGTNLRVELVEMVKGIVMGNKDVKLLWEYEYDLPSITNCYAIHRFPEKNGWANTYANTNGKVLMRHDGENEANYNQTFYLSEQVLPSITATPTIPSDEYEYLYTDERRNVTYEWNIPIPSIQVTLQVLSMKGLYGMDDSDGYKGKYNNYLLFGGFNNVTSEQGYDRILLAGAELNSADIVGTIASVGFKEFLYNTKTTNFSDAPFWISSAHSDTSIFTTRELADPILMHTVDNTTGSREQTNFGDSISIPLNIQILDSVASGFGLLFLLGDSNPYSPANPTAFPNLFWVILSQKDNEWYDAHFEVKSDICVLWEDQQKWTLKLSKQSNPSYSITPYFCLTGTNNEDKQVYVQRFGKKDETDIVYEHNFELDVNGKPVNYYVEWGDSSEGTIKFCTYTHEHPFHYYELKLSYTNTLQPGIYVLNIQRVPGVAKVLLNSIFHLNAVLQIDVGNISKTFDANKGWVILPKYSEGITNEGIPDEDGIEIYSPIVIIVPNKQLIKITTDKAFFRQNIGLYKIKTCSGLEIQNLVELQQDMISPYCEYMSNLAQTAENLYSLDKVKEYSFILKYGVFFKESYVFIDGLVNQGLIEGINVNLTYYSYPYIPSDPSILPISISPFDSNWTTWNAYVMPDSVLNVSDDDYPNFVFSNPIKDWSFSTKPLPGNLRQLVEL